MIRGIHHVQITISPGKEKEAEAFYCDILRLKKVEKPKALQGRGGFWLAAGELEIHVGTEDGVDRYATKGHVAYEVTDLEGWQDRLEKAGTTVISSVPIPGFDRFECRDPFGNRLELIQPRKD
ncbi:VOC family protein [Alkalicoccus urumqiensis]|uniref:Glyoxalase n=1 Tax=Alkalicoccus urumqiensis TaxID=1548213 RepID=A0A2P6MFL6_ALKUR|nr:VOC family protein [Alkalicoccus urumqiensis]PRO65057.1 glyoxalase [Alkalicoccus urumqiensis]